MRNCAPRAKKVFIYKAYKRSFDKFDGRRIFLEGLRSALFLIRHGLQDLTQTYEQWESTKKSRNNRTQLVDRSGN